MGVVVDRERAHQLQLVRGHKAFSGSIMVAALVFPLFTNERLDIWVLKISSGLHASFANNLQGGAPRRCRGSQEVGRVTTKASPPAHRPHHTFSRRLCSRCHGTVRLPGAQRQRKNSIVLGEYMYVCICV